jgi:hypothetical protein
MGARPYPERHIITWPTASGTVRPPCRVCVLCVRPCMFPCCAKINGPPPPHDSASHTFTDLSALQDKMADGKKWDVRIVCMGAGE